MCTQEDGTQQEEAGTAEKINHGTTPTQAEVEDHELTHSPFRNWCKHCVFGKAKNDARKKVEKEGDGTPTLVIDYAYLTEEFERGKRKEVIEGEGSPMIVMYDSKNSKAVFSFIVPQKGENEYAGRTSFFCVLDQQFSQVRFEIQPRFTFLQRSLADVWEP